MLPILLTAVGGAIGYFLKYFLDRKSELTTRHSEFKRAAYNDLLTILLDAMNGVTNQKQFKKRTTDSYRTLLLYASPGVINAYGDQMQYIYKKDNNTKLQMIYMARLFTAMRADLGLSNRGLGKNSENTLRPKFNDYKDYFPERTQNDK